MTREDQMRSSRLKIDDGGEDDSLARMLGQVLDASGDCGAYENESFLKWLELEARGRNSIADRRASERTAQQIAKRAQARIRVARVGNALPVLPFRTRAATIVGNVNSVVRTAADAGCAPWVESLAVAAGTGREIWDEPCEQWIEMPAGYTSGEHLALTVAGDSMTPCLHGGDVILVNTHSTVTRDSIVVARRADDGYVVKHVTRCGRAELELSSFNPEYAPFVIERGQGVIVGVVVARLARSGDAS
jgi:SOS-response transcriptional repressor LexA